ncbi:MAG: diacylglycerol kinase family protein [Microthrixaceae bacterium]
MPSQTPTASHRLAAVAALGACAASLALLLWLVLNATPRNMVVLVAAQAVAVGAAWLAVTRRGAARAVALVAIAAGELLALLVLRDNGDLMKWLGLMALLLGAAPLARRALRVDMRSLAEQPIEGTPVGPLAQPTLLMNPKSGGEKVAQFDLEAEARRRGITPILLGPDDDPVRLATQAVEAGADALGAAGGDGTQALVAAVAAEADLPFVCVPAGTRNHFALDLGLDRDDVLGALDAFGTAVERRVDLARVNGRTFVNNCSLGVYASIVQSDDYRDAKLKTAASMLPELLGPDADGFDLQFTDGEGRQRGSSQLLLISNNPYRLDRLGGFGTRARIDTGRLGLVDVQVESARDFQTMVALQAAGRVQQFDGWTEWTTPRLEVASREAVAIGVDGEALRMQPPLVFESWAGALRVRLPTHAPGKAPAAVALEPGWSTLGRLVEVAMGRSASHPSRGR